MLNVKKETYSDFTAGKIGWKFFDSISTGRYKITTTSGDLGDNSDDAGATKFWTDFVCRKTEKGHKEVTKIIYADNGSGMDYALLEGSFTLGFERKRTTKQLGKFGIGGTMGCLNMASEKLTISRDYMGKTIARKYDVEEIEKRDIWGTSAVEVTKEMENLLNKYVGKEGTGTVIVLSKFDRNNFGTRKDNLVNSLLKYYSTTYCEKIASGNFKVILDGKEVEPRDPLFWYHPDVIKVFDQKIPGTNYKIRMVNLKNIKDKNKNLLDGQGGYFFRCDRIIKEKVTNDLYWSKTWAKEANYRYVRWGVYFDADGDTDMGVTSDKSEVTPSQSIGDKIGQLVMPEAKIIQRETTKSLSKQTVEEKSQELEKISDLLKEIGEKENFEKSSLPDLSVDKNDEIKIEENVITHPHHQISIPSYITKDVSLGQLAEPFRMLKNENQEESRWKLEINIDHRYITKYYLNSSKEVRNAVISWIVPYAFSIMANPDTDACDMLDFRDMFNRKLIQVTTRVDNF